VVSCDELVETVWDGRPPGRAEVTLRSYVRRLRQVLEAGPGQRIETRPPGYLITVSGPELDLLEFDRLCRAGGAAVRAGDWDGAVGSLGAALGLWRAEPLADVPSETLRRRSCPA
jgi:DNA-binding SARP family transcriptional activator